MKKHFTIALDGPAGAGKSTIASLVAGELNLVYIDTGAMYRSFALYLINLGVNAEDNNKVKAALTSFNFDVIREKDKQHFYINGVDVSEDIRTPEVSMAASKVSAIPEVREYMVDAQRQMASEKSCILDGRDIGTKVLPDASLKIFLTASVEVRAKRRLLDLQSKNIEISLSEVTEDISKRDYQDTHRAVSPLRQAEDAICIDTSGLSIMQVVEKVVNLARKVDL